MIDFDLLQQSLPDLMRGAWVSMQIAFFSGLVGLFLGIPLAFMEQSSYWFARTVAKMYVILFRGTPMLVQILFVYYVLPQFGIHIPAVWAAVGAIGCNSGAYISQIILSGIKAVPIGQIEAAYTLGMSELATKRYIIFPQALQVALPSLGNEIVTLVKDSSLASVIGVMELSKEGSIIRSRTYDAFSVLLGVAGLYLVMTSLLTLLLMLYEKRKRYAIGR